jgi:hypothetical protein
MTCFLLLGVVSRDDHRELVSCSLVKCVGGEKGRYLYDVSTLWIAAAGGRRIKTMLATSTHNRGTNRGKKAAAKSAATVATNPSQATH